VRTLQLTFTTFVATFLTLWSFSQDSSLVTIHYPATLPATKVYVDYTNGKNFFRKQFDSSSDITFKKSRNWRYADVIIYYPDTAHKNAFILNTFWVGDQPAYIYILPDSNGKNHFLRYRLKNALNVADSGMSQFNLFGKAVYDSILTAIDLHQKAPSDSLEKIIDAQFNRFYYEELTFVRGLRESYFQLWLFRTQFANNHLLPVDTLLATYHSLFSDSIQKTPEGQFIAALIEKRLSAKIGSGVPDYALHSTSGRLINSQDTRGKYVLFDFWASWCGPCVQEMQKISELHTKYDTSKLLIVSITLDAQEKDFQAAVDRLHMTWPLIFGDSDIIKTFDVGPIPALFLMDPHGEIIYKSQETDGKETVGYDDAQLSKLNNLLSQRIGQH
jgi:thiol-disulfide isomerase/thioredoxin